MEGSVCNIQVLLRAAEFLDRRERGQYFTAVVLRGRSWLLLKQQNAQWEGSNLVNVMNAQTQRCGII